MRIVSGSRKGTPLKSLPGQLTRPTSDKVKESLFNMIGPYFDGGAAVELFGGSGSLSLEALSRGMEHAVIFEKNPKACAIIQANAEKCRFTDSIQIIRADARTASKRLSNSDVQADLLFVDPPYAEAKYYDIVLDLINAGLLEETAVIVCEHDPAVKLPESYGTFPLYKHSVYGNTAITIYMK